MREIPMVDFGVEGMDSRVCFDERGTFTDI